MEVSDTLIQYTRSVLQRVREACLKEKSELVHVSMHD